MNLKSIMLLTAAVLTFGTNSAFATPIVKTQVKLLLENFPKKAAFLDESLIPDQANLIDMSGFIWLDKEHPFITIWAKTKNSIGNPAIKLSLPVSNASKCKISFTYGPNASLSYKNGVAPSCENMGFSVSQLYKTAPQQYTLTIKYLG